MKIKKIKSQDKAFYPATIAQAVKDVNFVKEDKSSMTQGEVNLYLRLVILDNEEVTAASLNDLNDRIEDLVTIQLFLLLKNELEIRLKILNNFIEVEEPGFYVVDKNLNIGFAVELPEGYLIKK